MRFLNNKYFTCVSIVFLSFGQRGAIKHFGNNEKIRDVEEIEIRNDNGKIIVRNSVDDETSVESSGNFDIWQEGKKLFIRNRRPGFLGRLFQSGKMDFCIKVAPSVRNFKFDCAAGEVDIEDCSFANVRFKAADLKVRIKNVVGNLFLDCADVDCALINILGKVSLNGADVKGVLEDVRGDISADAGSCKLFYIMRDFFSPVTLFFDAADLKFQAFVSDRFRSIGLSRKMKIKKSYLPIYVDRQDCDFNISGDITSGNISFAPLSELNEDILHSISAYD